MNEQKRTFVQRCGELLKEAKPHLISCELKLGKDIPSNPTEVFAPNYDYEYVVVTCENGYTYKLPVEGNSLCETAHMIFQKCITNYVSTTNRQKEN